MVDVDSVEAIFDCFFVDDGKGGKAFVPKLLGDWIMKETYFKTIVGTDKVFFYQGGVYKPNGEAIIKQRCKELLLEKFSSRRVSETIAYIKASTFYNIDNTVDRNYIINLKNGLLNPDTLELMPHTPDFFSTIMIPIEYKPDATCPLWEQKLKEKCDEKTTIVLQEMFGYVFEPGQRHEVAFLFHGRPRTMKSTVLNILCQLMGEDNVTAFPLQQLNDDHFSMAYLFEKMANVCADLDSYSLKSTGKFMQIVGGDKITAGKKHEHHISFYPSAKLIFSCNIIPGTTNKDLAFYRRWIILTFDNQTPIGEIDPSMRSKLTTELPGILNWALRGLTRLKKADKFSYWLVPEQVKDLYERNSDSVSSFILNCIELSDDGDKITKRMVYGVYADYCNKLRLNKLNPVWFGRDFTATTGCGNSKLDDIPAYVGVKLKGVTTTYCGMNAYVPQ